MARPKKEVKEVKIEPRKEEPKKEINNNIITDAGIVYEKKG